MSPLLWLCLLPHSLADKFSEELAVVGLPDGSLNTVFKFTTVFEGADVRGAGEWAHYHLFPRQLGEVVARWQVQELQVSLTQGHWRYSSWGYPVQSTPTGAVVTARFLPSIKPQEVDDHWEGLTSGLAGLLCASLNKMDRTQGVSPAHSLQPRGALPGGGNWSSVAHLRHATLPKENLCTENLTPWKKLLPCKGRRGLATLLNSGSIQAHSSFQALLLSVRPVCRDASCTSLSTELSQTLNLVFHPAVANQGRRGHSHLRDWNLKHLFGIGVGSNCPLADNSQVFVDLGSKDFSLSPAPHTEVMTGEGTAVRSWGVYDVERLTEDGSIHNLWAVYPGNQAGYGLVHSAPLSVARHLAGTGQERGKVVAHLRNSGGQELTVAYLEVLPWFLRLYLHTLKVVCAGVEVPILSHHYQPGVDRERPYMVEVVLVLPPRSTVSLSLEFEHSLLRWAEYPPDANHGFYLGSGLLTARLETNSNLSLPGLQLAGQDSTIAHAIWGNTKAGGVLQLYTETLLVSLPTPDFSMPYNVICLACTVAALAFGPIHNITTRSLELVPAGQEEKGLLGKLVEKIKDLFGKLKKKKTVEEVCEVSKDDEDESVEDVQAVPSCSFSEGQSQ